MSDNTASTLYYVPDSDVSARLGPDDDAVLFKADTRRETRINQTGLFIWQRLDGARTAEQIATELSTFLEDPAPDTILQDIKEFLNDIEKNGFVVQQPGCEARQAAETDPLPSQTDGPGSLDLSLTGKCNLRCAYCFYHDEMESRPDLPLDDWLTFFDELKRLGVRDATLSGGEVFVRPDLWAIIDGLIDSRMRYSILSNGTLINEKTVQEFKKGSRFKRLNSIQISIDGSCAEVHDRSRGSGSFQKAIRSLRLLREAGFPVTVRVTVNHYNVDDLDNIARLLLEDIGIGSFSTNDAMPMGSGCENQKTITLTPQQQITAMKTLVRLAKQYNGRVTASAGPLAKWRMYREMEQARATGEMATRWKMGFLSACGCTFSKLSVHHDGTITPCNILSKLALGLINQDLLTDIWKAHPILQALKDRRDIPMTKVPGCEDCEWARFCNGSCPGLAHGLTGDINMANTHDCYRQFLKHTDGINFFNRDEKIS